MKYSTYTLGAIAFASSACAFPVAVFEALAKDPKALEKRNFTLPIPGFDASLQYISTSGSHAFVAPSFTDLRGPCPVCISDISDTQPN